AVAHVTNVAVSGGFSAVNNCSGALKAGQSCTIGVTFAPNSSGILSGALTIASDSTRAPIAVALSGEAVVPATPTPRATATPVRTPRPNPTQSVAPTPKPTATPRPTATPISTPSPAHAALVVTPHK